MKILIAALLVASSVFGLGFVDSPKVKREDLLRLTGAQWTGTLTYADYRTNKKVSIPSNLTVTQSATDKLSWTFEYQYPDEPKANSKDNIMLGKNGATIDDEKVVARKSLTGNTLMIVTEKAGSDNDKNALFRFTYMLSATAFSIKKEVRYEGTTEFFERNQYSWKR